MKTNQKSKFLSFALMLFLIGCEPNINQKNTRIADAQKIENSTTNQNNSIEKLKSDTHQWLNKFSEFNRRNKNAGPLQKKQVVDDYIEFTKTVDRKIPPIFAVVNNIEPFRTNGWPVVSFKSYEINNKNNLIITDSLVGDVITITNYGHYYFPPFIDEKINPDNFPGGVLFQKLSTFKPGDVVVITGVIADNRQGGKSSIEDGQTEFYNYEISYFRLGMYLTGIYRVDDYLKMMIK